MAPNPQCRARRVTQTPSSRYHRSRIDLHAGQLIAQSFAGAMQQHPDIVRAETQCRRPRGLAGRAGPGARLLARRTHSPLDCVCPGSAHCIALGLRAPVRCSIHQRKDLDRLCPHITPPAIAPSGSIASLGAKVHRHTVTPAALCKYDIGPTRLAKARLKRVAHAWSGEGYRLLKTRFSHATTLSTEFRGGNRPGVAENLACSTTLSIRHRPVF